MFSFKKDINKTAQNKRIVEKASKKDSLILQAFKKYLENNEKGLKLIQLIDSLSFFDP